MIYQPKPKCEHEWHHRRDNGRTCHSSSARILGDDWCSLCGTKRRRRDYWDGSLENKWELWTNHTVHFCECSYDSTHTRCCENRVPFPKTGTDDTGPR